MMKKIYNRYSFLLGLLLCISVFCGIGAYDLLKGNTPVAYVEIGLACLLLVYVIVVSVMRQLDMKNYMSILIERGDNVSHNAVTMLPIPMIVLSVDGYIMWYNDLFMELVESDGLYNVQISEILKDLKWNEILKSENIASRCNYNGRIYNITGRIVRNNDDISVLLYFDDITDIENLTEKYENERTVFGIVVIDNYDDLFGKMDNVESQQTSAEVNRIISEWAEETNGIIKRLERDRYLVIFEQKMLPECIAKKFDVLEKVHALGEQKQVPVSVSIGIGIGDSLAESEEFARVALGMSEGRGGDQAVVKDSTRFSFYGGRTREYEKSTRVKTRTFSKALVDFIKNSENVFLMGHENADFDCFGASVALSKAIMDMGKKAYIVYDNSPASEPLAGPLRQMSEYVDVLVSAEYAREIAAKSSLLIVLDTHRPSMLPCAELLDLCENVILIDHHRRSPEFLPKTSLMYHEPYASSTCEMVTEVLQYIDDKRKIGVFEAKALYVGIVMDTKNFMVKTGARTFEAASLLRKYGVDTSEVKKLFSMDKNDYLCKMRTMENMEVYACNLAIASTEEKYSNIRVVASSACDDLLNVRGVKASFVVYPIEGSACVSARSLGEENVQLICERLGGGGHTTIAGAQLKGVSVDDAKIQLKMAIDKYLEEDKAE